MPNFMAQMAALQAALGNQNFLLGGAGVNQQAAIAAQQANQFNQQQQQSLAQAIQGVRNTDVSALTALATGQTQENVVTPGQQGVVHGLAGGLGQGVGMLLGGLSDERAKKNVESGDPAIQDFLNALNPHKYDYKKDTAFDLPEGKHVSVMAQELEKTPLGAQMVKEVEGAKFVDYGQGLAVMLASVSQLNNRVNQLEV